MDNMVNVATVDLSAKDFNDVINFNFIVLENMNIKENDYILFRQCEKDGETVAYTGQNQIMRVKSINTSNSALKAGFAIIMLAKI